MTSPLFVITYNTALRKAKIKTKSLIFFVCLLKKLIIDFNLRIQKINLKHLLNNDFTN